MGNFILAFSVVFPLFLMMSLGYFLRCIKMFNDDFLKQLNNLCFKVFLPIILFVNIYQSDFRSAFSPTLLLFAVLSIFICFTILFIVVPLFEKDNRRRGVIIQGIFRSNYVLFGLPIASSLFSGDDVGITAVLIAFVVPLFNTLSVVALEVFRGGKKIDIKKITVGVITNPLIIAAAIGFLFTVTGFKLPALLDKTVVDISKIATPFALIILGGSFRFSQIKGNVKALIFSAIGRLLCVPLTFLPIAVLVGFRNAELAALMAMFASPTAVSSFTMAQNMDADSELAAQIVVVNSLFSVITIFVYIVILKHFAFI